VILMKKKNKLYAAFEADVEANEKGLRKCIKEGGYEANREVSGWKKTEYWMTELSEEVMGVMKEMFRGSGGAFRGNFYNDPYEKGWSTAVVWVDLVNSKLTELGCEST